jgi:transcriptional regulator with XRE-family HTH domain
MCASAYPAWVKTIEVIRMANYHRLVAELQGDGPPLRSADVARALGISKVYAWQLENGKRDAIDSKAARLIERSMKKEEGWMDTDFELWPFPDAELLVALTALKRDQRLEIQGVIRRHLAELQPPSSGKSVGSSSMAGPRRAA